MVGRAYIPFSFGTLPAVMNSARNALNRVPLRCWLRFKADLKNFSLPFIGRTNLASAILLSPISLAVGYWYQGWMKRRLVNMQNGFAHINIQNVFGFNVIWMGRSHNCILCQDNLLQLDHTFWCRHVQYYKKENHPSTVHIIIRGYRAWRLIVYTWECASCIALIFINVSTVTTYTIHLNAINRDNVNYQKNILE